MDVSRECQLLSSRVCLYLSDVSLRCGRHLDAVHFARLATQVEPDSERLAFFLSCALVKVDGGTQEGARIWLRHRRIDSFVTTLEQRQDLLSSLIRKKEVENNCDDHHYVYVRQKCKQISLTCRPSERNTTLSSLK